MSKNEITEIQPFLESALSKYFKVYREYKVGNYRPDFIVKCLVSNQIYGIECKAKDIQKGSEVYSWIHQAKTYSELCKIPFLVFPQISHRIFQEANLIHPKILAPHHNFSTFLGAYGVGEVAVERRGSFLKISFNFLGKRIWENSMNEECSANPQTKNYNLIMERLNYV